MNTTPLVLEDIIPPQDISVWPLALGWWLLLIIGITVIAFMVVIIKRHRKKWEYRKHALSLLDNHYQQWHLNGDNAESLQALTRILKRTAMTAYPQGQLASLYGHQWVDFLNQQTKQPLFNHELSQAIEKGLYQSQPQVDISHFYHCCQRWIKTHNTKIKAGK